MIDSYEKLTVGKYLDIKEILEDDTDELDKNVRMIAVLGEFDEEDVLEFPLQVFNRYLQATSFLMENPRKRVVSTSYVLGGQKLDVQLNVEKMTTAQFIDYQTFVKDDDKIVELLSVFLIPKGKKYNKEYDILDVQKLIRENLCILDAISMSAFFLEWCQALSQVTITSLTKKMKKMMRKEKDMEKKKMMQEAITNLERSGDGLVWLTEYQRQSENLGV